MSKVRIIDYGVGNLLNVVRAFKACQVEAEIISDPSYLRSADRVVLPGVGAFRDGMAQLEVRGFASELKEYLGFERPLLGICLGMQLLFDQSEEFGIVDGLGVIPGRVIKIPDVGPTGVRHKIPHMGWNDLIVNDVAKDRNSLLAGLSPNRSVYFVHSYMVQPVDASIVTARVDYDGVSIPAMIHHRNIYAAQFHPERSGETGLLMLANFAKI